MGKKGCNPRGVKARTNAIQIKFKLKGEADYCYETLKWSPTQTNLNKAGNLREEIVTKIKHDAFVYGDYFPDSPRAQNASGTFFDYAQAWLDDPTHSWTKKSRYKFLSILQSVWLPTLENKIVRFITITHITDALAHALVHFKEKNGGKEPSRSYYNDWLLCVRGVFGTAAKANAIRPLEDPTQYLKNKARITNDIDPFDIDEANAIIAHAYAKYDDMMGAWFELGFYSGMRYPSEPAALTWADIDLRKFEVRISKIMTREGIQNSTKTGKSRILRLNSRSRNALERVIALNCSNAIAVEGNVFKNARGEAVIEAKGQRNAWKAILGELGIRYRDMYNMRHTYATFGLMNGVNPAFMASQLGHSIEEFFKTYAKWINSQQDDVQIGLIERAISNQVMQTPRND